MAETSGCASCREGAWEPSGVPQWTPVGSRTEPLPVEHRAGKPRAGSRRGRLQRPLWEAFLFRCHVWEAEALFGATANRKGKAKSLVSGGFFRGREGPSVASAFRRASPGSGPGRQGQARSEG